MFFYKINTILLLIIVSLSSCTSDQGGGEKTSLNLRGEWSQSGLETLTINEFNTTSQQIFAATTQGLYLLTLSSQNNNPWIAKGLEHKEIIGFAVLNDQEIVAGIRLVDIESDEPSLFKTRDGGSSWHSFQNNFGGQDKYNWISAITQQPDIPSTIYSTGTVLNIAKSTNAGSNWQLLNGTWNPNLGVSTFIKVSATDPNYIWTGGRTPTFAPLLIKSEDDGTTWKRLTVIENVESTVYDVATNPSNPHIVLVGMAGVVSQAKVIRKSTDGGQTWQTVLEGINTYTLTHSARNPEIVYASGRNATGTLFFAASGDFGDTWETVEFEGGPTRMYVNDMISVLQNGKEVLYFGTNKGVYSYTFDE